MMTDNIIDKSIVSEWEQSLDGYTVSFFFPYHEVSGVPVLFANLANYMSMELGLDVNIIDYENGALVRNVIANPKIHFIRFQDFVPLEVKKTILIMQANIPYANRNELKIDDSTKVIHWVLYPNNLAPVLFPFPLVRNLQYDHVKDFRIISRLFFRRKYQALRDFIHHANKKNALFFMDSSTVQKTQELLYMDSFAKKYLPITSDGPVKRPDEKNIAEKGRSLREHLHAGWVGRLCDFKTHILVHFAEKLALIAAARKWPITLHVIGSGPYAGLLDKVGKNNPYFTIKMHGSMEKPEMETFLRDNIHLLGAMGTAALDGARLAIPVALLHYAFRPVTQDYKFRWLKETPEFDVGHQLTADDYEENNTSLDDMLQELYTNYSAAAESSYNYFKDKHSVAAVARMLVEQIKQTDLLHKDIPAVLKKVALSRKIHYKIKEIKGSYY